MTNRAENTARIDLVAASRLSSNYRPASLPKSDGGWDLDALAGRLVELSGAPGSAALTVTTSLAVAAQLRGESVVWINVGRSSVYPLDLAESGIDLDAFPFVRAPNLRVATRAAERLLRSGGFVLVVVDLVGEASSLPRAQARYARSYAPSFSKNGEYNAQRVLHEGEQKRNAQRRYVGASRSPQKTSFAGRSESYLPASSQSRLAGLAKKHRTVLLFLTCKEESAPSLGSLVSFRGTGQVRKTAFDRFAWTLEVQKDKHRGPGWTHSEVCRGPTGLF